MNLFTVFVLFFGLCAGHEVNKVVFCYYGTWATYRSGNGKFDVENINPDLCTHVAYTFVGINEQGTIISLDSYLDLPDGRDNFGKFVALKNQNPNLKTILAVGGWNEGSAKYSTMAASPTLRSNFIQSALQMILDYGFDGLDLDWEYPNQRDSVYGQADVDNFSQLIRELRIAFDTYGLILSAAVSAAEESATLSYDVPTISEYLDFINIMAYDFYGSWNSDTGYNAALHKGEGDENADPATLLTVDNAVQYWLSAGAAPEKLILGVPFYGRTFTLSSASENTVRSPASGAGISGPYTLTNGFLGYNEFCDMLQTESWTVKFDDLAKVPYAFRNLDWVSYDDPTSITYKANYAKKYNLGGIMLWSIETDDFHAICGSEDFPLLRAINRALDRDVSPSTATPSSSSTTESVSSSTEQSVSSESTSTTSTSTTTSAPSQPESSVCKNVGFQANPDDCSSYFMCVDGVDGTLIPYKFNCPASLRWDQDHYVCNYAENVQCDL